MFLTWICIAATLCSSCNNDLIEYRKGDIKVSIEAGDAYLHDFPLFMGIKRKNAPQMAVWIEDMQGNYLENQTLQPDILVYNEPAASLKGEDAQLKAAVDYLLKDLSKKK